MQQQQAETFRPVRPEMRWWLYLDTLLVFGAGVQLFVLTEQTDRYFAWTINPPLTAAFIGACYWGALPLVLLSAREKLWANARAAVPGVWLFTLIATIATFMHIDRFHMDSIFGWIWVIVYLLVPLLLPLLFIRQQFGPGLPDPPRTHPLPGWLRLSTGPQSAIMIVLGLILFVAPQTAATLWPWTLTPLTGRMVGAWLIGIGCVQAQGLWEADLRRVRNGLIASAVLGTLQLIALARYAGTLDWSKPQLWIYLLFLIWFTAIALLGWRAALQAYKATLQAQLSPY